VKEEEEEEEVAPVLFVAFPGLAGYLLPVMAD
jgi:hypothetical protein